MYIGIFISRALHEQIKRNGIILPYTAADENYTDEIKYFIFEDYAELKEIFSKESEKLDCAVTENLTAASMISEAAEEHSIAVCGIKVSDGTFYRSVLTQGVLLRQIDLARASFDFIPCGTCVSECIKENLLSFYRKQNSDAIEKLLLENPAEVEDYILRKYKEKYLSGKLDFMFTRNHKSALFAEENGIGYYFICPSDEEIKAAVAEAKAGAEEIQRKKDLPAVVTLSPASKESSPSSSLNDLEEAAAEYGKSNSVRLPLRKNGSGFEIYTDAATVRQITGDFKSCGISDFLCGRLDFPVTVGYGIGSNIQQARVNSCEAASFCAPGRNVRLIDEEGNEFLLETCPCECVSSLTSGESAVIKRASALSGLSSAVITQVLLCMKKLDRDEISSSELMTELGVSPRVANKYLSKLETAGLAEISGHKQNGGKGRPTKIYRITITDNRKIQEDKI